jgi:hypothetical protein
MCASKNQGPWVQFVTRGPPDDLPALHISLYMDGICICECETLKDPVSFGRCLDYTEQRRGFGGAEFVFHYAKREC